MKFPRIKFTPSTRAKAKGERTSTLDTGAKSAAPARQTTGALRVRLSAPCSRPNSRWNVDEPIPVLPNLGKQPAKEECKHPPKDPPPFPKLHFELFVRDACAVFLAGSFNDWSPTATPMHRESDVKWIVALLLPPGRYEYQFVVDGRWTRDPKAADEVPNPFGGRNSVVEVSASS